MTFMTPASPQQKHLGTSFSDLAHQIYLYQRNRVKELVIGRDEKYSRDNKDHEALLEVIF